MEVDFLIRLASSDEYNIALELYMDTGLAQHIRKTNYGSIEAS